jgi:hypothetical protein
MFCTCKLELFPRGGALKCVGFLCKVGRTVDLAIGLGLLASKLTSEQASN